MQDNKSENFFEEDRYNKLGGRRLLKPMYLRQSVPFLENSADISRDDIFKLARKTAFPTSFTRENVYIFPYEEIKRKTVYTYIKLFPETTLLNVIHAAFDFRVDPHFINYEICYKNHISNCLLNEIIKGIDTGNELCVSKLSDLGGTAGSIFSKIKKLRDKKAILHVSDVLVDFDFSPFIKKKTNEIVYDSRSYRMLDFFLKIYSDNSSINIAKRRNALHPISIDDFSDDFLRFYYDYTNVKADTTQKVGSKIKDYAKTLGLSANTVYKRIAWLNAHPIEVASRYNRINGIHYNSPVSFSKESRIYFNSAETNQKNDFYKYVLNLSKEKRNLSLERYTIENYIFYYKITSNTSLDDIIKFCDYCNDLLYYKIDLEEIGDYYKIANQIVWEYSYPSKEVNTKLYSLLSDSSDGSRYDFVTYGFHHLSFSSVKIFDIMKRLFKHYSNICTPELDISDSDFEFLSEIFRNLPKANNTDNKKKKRGRPALKASDLPQQFFPLYNQYMILKQQHKPLNGIVQKISEECGVTPKTAYDWIHRISSNRLK